jgi:large subunit ribosomal protein L25
VSEVRLSAEVRSEFGKGGARRTRRAGKIPAVIYGHGADPRHVSLPAREFAAAIRNGGANVLLTLELEGKDELAIPKAIQRHAIKGTYDHVDLLAVRRGEKVTVEVPLSVVGEAVAGGLLAQEHLSIHLAAEATNLPTGIEVSIAGLQIGEHITAGDLTLPEGAALIGDPEQVLLVMQEAPTAADLEATEGEGIEAAAPAESPAAEAVPAAGEGSSTE